VYPIDEFIFNKFLKRTDFIVYQLSPAICVQEMQLNKNDFTIPSQLENERKLAQKNKNRSKRREDAIKRGFWGGLLYILNKPIREINKIKNKKRESKPLNVIEFK
ncbi:beta-1,4 galactosyltransferase, partial [Bisgaard Taxon 45]